MKTGGIDTGAKMEICGASLPVRLGIDISSLFPIKAKGANIETISGILVKLSAPRREKTRWGRLVDNKPSTD